MIRSWTLSLLMVVLPGVAAALSAGDLEFSAGGGYRTDRVNWSIAGTLAGTDPDVLSELTWEEIRIYEIRMRGRYHFYNHVLLDGRFSYGAITDGRNIDSDFFGNNRTDEFSRSTSTTAGEHAWSFSGGGGYRFVFGQRTGVDMGVDLLGGYSRHRINLEDRDGVQLIPDFGPFPISGTTAIYEAEIDGPWAGTAFHAEGTRLGGRVSFEYHDANYVAVADWPLREDFRHPLSFEQESDGYGILFALSAFYVIREPFRINFQFDYHDWEIGSGIDRTFFTSGQIIETRLNEVDWKSTAIQVGIGVDF